MRSNEDYSYEKSGYYRQSNQNTAAKSPERKRVDQTQEYTPTRFTKKPSDRISGMKNSINRCIEELSAKKQTNREALQEVKDVNREILQNLSGQGRGFRSSQRADDFNERPQYRTDYAPRWDPSQDKQRDNVTLSSFNLAPLDNHMGQSYFQASQVYRPESRASNQYQIQELRQRIRNQRAQNANLQRHLQQLQNQQHQLSSQSQRGEDPYLVSQNLRLREELSRVNQNQSIQAIYEEFQRLKEDNQRLRRETIGMLKNGRY